MITEGEAAILLETTRRAFHNQSQLKQRSTLQFLRRNLKDCVNSNVYVP